MGFLCWARGFMELGQGMGSRTELTETLRRYCSSPGALPLLLFPEEDTTNGRAGLLKFRYYMHYFPIAAGLIYRLGMYRNFIRCKFGIIGFRLKN